MMTSITRRTATALGVATLLAGSLLGGSAAGASMPGKPFTETQCPGDTDSVARLYTAGLGRQPEVGGFEFWVEEYVAGRWTFPRMAQFFVESPEFAQSYGSLDDEGFVRQLYRNVLGREGEDGGVAHWAGQLAAGSTRATVLMRFAESPENIANSGTSQPTLGEFNEGRAPGAWYCGPPMEPYLLAAGDWTGSTDGEFTEWASDEECIGRLGLPEPSPGSGRYSATGESYIDHELHHYATPLGARTFLQALQDAPDVCFVLGADGGLNVFTQSGRSTIPSARPIGSRDAVVLEYQVDGLGLVQIIVVRIANVVSMTSHWAFVGEGIDEGTAVEFATRLSDRVAADLGTP